MVKILSLFSGAGGLDLGFRNAEFKIVLSNENDKDTYATYDYNFPKTKHIKDSIKNLKGSILEEGFDGIIGGPPCQSWSEAGKQKGINDPRGRLFYEYVRILKIVKPRFFLAENVSGMLHKKHSNALKNITDQFKENGYNINFQLVDAVDFGVPQNRKRVFIVGIKKELERSFTFPSSKLFKNPETLRDCLKGLPKPIPALEKNKTNFKKINLKQNLIHNNEYMIGGFSTIFMSRNRVRDWNEPSYTIQAGGRHAPIHPDAPKMIKVKKDKFKFCENNLNKYRRLSVRECARIQTFPDEFIFFYNQISAAYKMIGNAVPVKLSEVFALEIKKQLFVD